jgi:hypothetical protein
VGTWHIVSRTLSIMATSILIGGLIFFVYYSLYIYKSSDHVACQSSALARQTDVAVHVIRQWFGKEGQIYTPCPGTNQ